MSGLTEHGLWRAVHELDLYELREEIHECQEAIELSQGVPGMEETVEQLRAALAKRMARYMLLLEQKP